MRVEPILLPLLEKYKADENDPYLFNFHSRMTTSDSFNANVNTGLRKVCESMGMPKEEWFSAYTFRHTWGTVAQNDCGATIDEVAFANEPQQWACCNERIYQVGFLSCLGT